MAQRRLLSKLVHEQTELQSLDFPSLMRVLGEGSLGAAVYARLKSDLLELLDDRVGSRSTLITSQLPVTARHAWLDEPTLADAILDRIVHGSHKIALKGESMRKLTKAV